MATRGRNDERPDLATEEGRLAFIHVLNARLPKKRAIAQGVLTNDRDEILLCQLTYKAEWDLPGGVVDPGESPARCLEREVREELGLDLTAGELLAVNWLPPYRGWDDAVLFLFDLGRLPTKESDRIRLAPRELAAVHWLPPTAVGGRVAGYTAAMLTEVFSGRGGTAYLENSVVPDRN